MNKRLRYILLCSTLFFPQAHASESLKTTGNLLVNTVGSVAITPFILLGLPFSMASELLFPKSKEVTEEKVTVITEALPPAPVTKTQALVPIPPALEQQITTNPQITTASNAQVTELVDIPLILETVVAAIPKNSDAPVFINLNLNNQQAAATNTTKVNQPDPLPTVQPKPSWIRSTRGYITSKLFGVTSWIFKNKFRFMGSCGVGLYTGIHLYMWHVSRTLSSDDSWANWKRICSLPELYQTNQEELIKSMMISLKEAYQNNNPLENVQRFLKEASKELKHLRNYQRICATLNFCYMRWLFFLGSTLEAIPERIRRLEFLKNTMLGWLNEHKKTYTLDNMFTPNSKG